MGVVIEIVIICGRDADTRFVPSPAAKFERITLPRTNYFTVTASGIGNWERANFSGERSRDKFARIVNKMRPKCSENRILEIDANPAGVRVAMPRVR